jgi:hypothetical protein
LLLYVKWGRKVLIEPEIVCFEVHWLRRTTLRGMLTHVIEENNPDLTLESADSIAVSVVQHIEELSSFGGSRKRPTVKLNVSRMIDDEVYDLMQDLSIRQFDFEVKVVGPDETSQAHTGD